jgi:hypothetical protein
VRTVVVSLDTWHAMIAFPLPSGGFEEWGYAERAWYLEGRQGVSGVLRALLWPTAAVVEVTVSNRLWAQRTPQPPADVFVLRLGETGYRRLRDHLASTIGVAEPVVVIGESRFYTARRAYHVFHQCHQYAAGALAAAGLPVSVTFAFTRGALAAQLRRLATPSRIEASDGADVGHRLPLAQPSPSAASRPPTRAGLGPGPRS